MKDDRRKCLDAGASDYIAKPVQERAAPLAPARLARPPALNPPTPRPRRPSRARSRRPTPGDPPVPTEPRVNILMVDDTPNNLFVLEATLGELGQNLVRAGSGVEALRRLLDDDDFAVILMDVQMPGMDGFEVADLIRQRDRTRLTPDHLPDRLRAHRRRRCSGATPSGRWTSCSSRSCPRCCGRRSGCSSTCTGRLSRSRQAEQLRENERQELEHRLAEERRRAEEDRWQLTLRIAREVQQKFFPAAPPASPGFELGGASHPAEVTGGDYYDYIPLPDGGVGDRRRRRLRPRGRPGLADGGDPGLPARPGADQYPGGRHPHPGQSHPRRGRRRRPVRHPDHGPPRPGRADARLLPTPGIRPATSCGRTGRSGRSSPAPACRWASSTTPSSPRRRPSRWSPATSSCC